MDIFKRTVFISGPPRSGTTISSRALNMHPLVYNYIDDHVHECWALYYYRTRVGLVQDIRNGNTDRVEARDKLIFHLQEDDQLKGIAPSPKTLNMPKAPPPKRPGQAINNADKKLQRHIIPIKSLPQDWILCLKSPEISFVLPQMRGMFPETKFIFVYRPVAEIVESMHRKGHTVKKVAVYHRRWRDEKKSDGTLLAPPGVPEIWEHLWNRVSDLNRCAIYAASYLKSLTESLPHLNPQNYFVYNHADFRRNPEKILPALASFLGIEPGGFNEIAGLLNTESPEISEAITAELSELEDVLETKKLEQAIASYHL